MRATFLISETASLMRLMAGCDFQPKARRRKRARNSHLCALAEGVEVRVTSPAKTVADCFRYRQHVGLDVAMAALRDYLREHRGGMNALVDAARADRVYTFVRPYLEALA